MPSGYELVRDAIRELIEIPRFDDNTAFVGIGPQYSPRDPLLAKFSSGLIHVFIKVPDDSNLLMPPVGDALHAEWSTMPNPEGGIETYLNLSCRDESLLPTFHSLIGEMIDRMEQSGQQAMSEFISVLESWRNALAQARNEVSQRSITGMFGELSTLTQVARIRPADALHLWRGSAGHYHDFAGTNALEVKTFRSHNSPTVTINGPYQLDPPHNGSLYLRALRIVEDNDGKSLFELYEDLLTQGLSSLELRPRLNTLLSNEESAHTRFRIDTERLFFVDDTFPGIRASRLDELSLVGVSNVSYQLYLDACPNLLESSMLDEVISKL